jgi:segregation and condensation protein B
MSDRPQSSSQSPPATPARAPTEAGLSLDELNQAFAQLLAGGHDPYRKPPEEELPTDQPEMNPRLAFEIEEDVDRACEITPRSILEAMLFVGDPANRPLAPDQVAGLMRGVRPAEIEGLVGELNREYAANRCPYRIESEGAGYKLALCDEFAAVREKCYGRAKESRLSDPAIEVLALVAYRGPLTADEISKLRPGPCAAILSQLVRRQLLKIERVEEKKKKVVPRYHTTKRFLELVGVERLEDLPRNQDVDIQ